MWLAHCITRLVCNYCYVDLGEYSIYFSIGESRRVNLLRSTKWTCWARYIGPAIDNTTIADTGTADDGRIFATNAAAVAAATDTAAKLRIVSSAAAASTAALTRSTSALTAPMRSAYSGSTDKSAILVCNSVWEL